VAIELTGLRKPITTDNRSGGAYRIGLMLITRAVAGVVYTVYKRGSKVLSIVDQSIACSAMGEEKKRSKSIGVHMAYFDKT